MGSQEKDLLRSQLEAERGAHLHTRERESTRQAEMSSQRQRTRDGELLVEEARRQLHAAEGVARRAEGDTAMVQVRRWPNQRRNKVANRKNGDFRVGRAHAAVSRRPPISLPRSVALTKWLHVSRDRKLEQGCRRGQPTSFQCRSNLCRGVVSSASSSCTALPVMGPPGAVFVFTATECLTVLAALWSPRRLSCACESRRWRRCAGEMLPRPVSTPVT